MLVVRGCHSERTPEHLLSLFCHPPELKIYFLAEQKSSNKCDSRSSKKERYGNPNDHPGTHYCTFSTSLVLLNLKNTRIFIDHSLFDDHGSWIHETRIHAYAHTHCNTNEIQSAFKNGKVALHSCSVAQPLCQEYK